MPLPIARAHQAPDHDGIGTVTLRCGHQHRGIERRNLFDADRQAVFQVERREQQRNAAASTVHAQPSGDRGIHFLVEYSRPCAVIERQPEQGAGAIGRELRLTGATQDFQHRGRRIAHVQQQCGGGGVVAWWKLRAPEIELLQQRWPVGKRGADHRILQYLRRTRDLDQHHPESNPRRRIARRRFLVRNCHFRLVQPAYRLGKGKQRKLAEQYRKDAAKGDLATHALGR